MTMTDKFPGAVDPWDPPLGDVPLDELFPNADDPLRPTSVTTPTATPAPAAATTPAPAPFYVSTYKSREDAEQGIAHKDALIADLRKQVATSTGVDPLTNRPVAPAPQSGGTPTQVVHEGAQTPKPHFQRVVDAVRKAQEGDFSEYEQVQREFVYESLGPIMPSFLESQRRTTVEVVDERYPGFKTFFRGGGFREALGQVPENLRRAVEAAEASPMYLNDLPGLYETVYLVSQGLRVPELLKSAETQPPLAAPAPGQAPAAQTPRPTMTSSTPTPPSAAATTPTLSTQEGRDEIIRRFERSGKATQPLRW